MAALGRGAIEVGLAVRKVITRAELHPREFISNKTAESDAKLVQP